MVEHLSVGWFDHDDIKPSRVAVQRESANS